MAKNRKRQKTHRQPTVMYALPTDLDGEPLMTGWIEDLHQHAWQALQKVTPRYESVKFVDYQHKTYTVQPHRYARWPRIPVGLIPAGDDYFIEDLSGNFAFGAWCSEWTLRVIGGELLRCLDGFWMGDCLELISGIDLEAEIEDGLVQFLKDKLPQYAACVQAHTLKVLAEQGYDEVLDAVKKPLLNNKDVNVRFDAALACLYLGDERCLTVLRSILENHVVPEGYYYLELNQIRFERVLDGLTFPGRAQDLQAELLDYLAQKPPAINTKHVFELIREGPFFLREEIGFPLGGESVYDQVFLRQSALSKLAADLGHREDQLGLNYLLDALTDVDALNARCSALAQDWWHWNWSDIIQALVMADHRQGLRRVYDLAARRPPPRMDTHWLERVMIYSELAKAFVQIGDQPYIRECFQLAEQAIHGSRSDDDYWFETDHGLKTLAHAHSLLGDSEQALTAAQQIRNTETRQEVLDLLST